MGNICIKPDLEKLVSSNLSSPALLVRAKDETARAWCLNWEFEPSPSDPFHLFLLMKDLKAMASG